MSETSNIQSLNSDPFRLGVSLKSILDKMAEHLKPVFGDTNIIVYGPCSQTHPIKDALVFVRDAESLTGLLPSPVAAIVCPARFVEKAIEKNSLRKVIISSENTYLSMALVNAQFFSLPFVKKVEGTTAISKLASVSPKAELGKNVIIGPHVVISEGCQIGDNTFIGANTVIEAYTSLGESCFIHPLVYIGHSCQIGNRVEIKPHSTVGSDGYGYAHDSLGHHYRIPHYGPVIIEDDVHIGANVNIDRGTFESAHIGAGTKIDNHCHFGHNVRIGKNCLITAGMITTGSVTIGDNCVFGGRTTVNGHITIASGCTFGGLTGINKSITEPGQYAGYPAIPFRESLKVQMSLTQLPRMRKKMALILKKLGLDESEGVRE